MSTDHIEQGGDRDQILAEHRRLHELTSSLPETFVPDDFAGVLQSMQTLLVTHFRREEQQSGLHASILHRTPHHARLLEQLDGEHQSLLDQVAALRTRTRQLIDGPIAALRRDFDTFLVRLKDHEVRETELFLDSIWTDLGQGD